MDPQLPTFPRFSNVQWIFGSPGVVSFNSALNAFSFQNSWSLPSGCHGFAELTQTEVLMESQQRKKPNNSLGVCWIWPCKRGETGPCFFVFRITRSFEIQLWNDPNKNRFMFLFREVSSLATVTQWSWAGAKYHHLQHRLMCWRWWVFFFLDPINYRFKGKTKVYKMCDFLFLVVFFWGWTYQDF